MRKPPIRHVQSAVPGLLQNFWSKYSHKAGGKGVVVEIGGRRTAIGPALIQIPFVSLGIIIDVDFLIFSEPVPSLLSMKDMVLNGLDISIQRRQVTLREHSQDIDMENFFLIHRWRPEDLTCLLYTKDELRRINRNFGLRSVRATIGMMKRAQDGVLSRRDHRMLRAIAAQCKTCARHAASPRRFKLTVQTDDLRFNHTVYLDTIFIDRKPVLNIVDLATHFCADGFLRAQKTKEIWRQIQQLWSLTYAGPPDYLFIDQGSAYVSAEMRKTVSAAVTELMEAPVETPGRIGVVERYHAPLRVAYQKLREELPHDHTNHDC